MLFFFPSTSSGTMAAEKGEAFFLPFDKLRDHGGRKGGCFFSSLRQAQGPWRPKKWVLFFFPSTSSRNMAAEKVGAFFHPFDKLKDRGAALSAKICFT